MNIFRQPFARLPKPFRQYSIMLKNYNYERKKVRLPEYGRHIQDMVEYLMTIEDREVRNRQARVVVGVMGNVNPALRDSVDFNRKLWDHLFIMSDFQLDVDAPYPKPAPDSLNPTPHKPEYPRKNIRLKHYGKYIEKIIRKVEQFDDREATAEALGSVARYMRARGYEFNQEHPNNETIIRDIKRMSENGIEVDESVITNSKNDYKQRPAGYVRRNNPKKFNNKFKKQGQRNQGRQ